MASETFQLESLRNFSTPPSSSTHKAGGPRALVTTTDNSFVPARRRFETSNSRICFQPDDSSFGPDWPLTKICALRNARARRTALGGAWLNSNTRRKSAVNEMFRYGLVYGCRV